MEHKKIEKLSNLLLERKKELAELKKEKKDAIKAAQERVEGRFNPLIAAKKQNFTTLLSSITDFYTRKGTFDVQDVGNIICQLVNHYEEPKYEFRQAVVRQEGWDGDCWALIKEYEGLVIAQSNRFFEEGNEIKIYSRVEDFPGIIVLSSNSNLEKVELAGAQFIEDRIRVFQKVQYGVGSDYVYKFISKLVDYKVEKKKDDISYDQMKDLMDEFIKERAIIEPKKEKEHQLSKKRYS